MFQITGPPDTFSVPRNTDLTIGLGNWELSGRLQGWQCFYVKILLTTGGDSPLLTLYISVARHWIFLSWMGIELPFSKSILKDDCLLLYIIHKHLSCSLFIFIFVVWLWHIQISGQKLNCEFEKKAFITMRRLDKSNNGAALASV